MCQLAPSPRPARGAHAFSLTLRPPPSCCLEVPRVPGTPPAQPRGVTALRAPAADCRASVPCLRPYCLAPASDPGVYFLPPRSREPSKALAGLAVGTPSPPPAACTFLAEVSPANGVQPSARVFRLPPFLDTEVLNGTRPGHPLCARGSEETRQKEKYNTEPSRLLGCLARPACSHPQNILRNNAFLLGDPVLCLENLLAGVRVEST